MHIQYLICPELICIAGRWIHKEQDKLSLTLSYTQEMNIQITKQTVSKTVLHPGKT